MTTEVRIIIFFFALTLILHAIAIIIYVIKDGNYEKKVTISVLIFIILSTTTHLTFTPVLKKHPLTDTGCFLRKKVHRHVQYIFLVNNNEKAYREVSYTKIKNFKKGNCYVITFDRSLLNNHLIEATLISES